MSVFRKQRAVFSQDAFTLLEVLISLAASGIVLASVGIVLTSTLDTASVVEDESSALMAARFALARMASRLSNAVSFTETSPNSVTFSCAQPPDASTVSTIRYSWTGTAGGALTESVNASSPLAIAANVKALSFSYLTEPETTIGTGPHSTIQPGVACQFSGFSPGAPIEKDDESVVDDKHSVGELFTATSAADRLTSITLRFSEAAYPPPSTMCVEIRRATSGGAPGPASLLAAGTVDRLLITSTPQDISVPLTHVGAEGLQPGLDYFIVCKYVSGSGPAGRVWFQKLKGSDSELIPYANGMMYKYSEDSGATWKDEGNSRDLFFTLRGQSTVVMTGRTVVTQQVLNAVRVGLIVEQNGRTVQLQRDIKLRNL